MVPCPHHDRTPQGRVCPHLFVQQDDYIQRFTGAGLAYDLLCAQCGKEADTVEATLIPACSECFQQIEQEGSWEGILGRPEILISDRKLRFEHETFLLPELQGSSFLNIQPVEGTEGTWLGCTSAGSLIEIDVTRRHSCTVAQVPKDVLEFDGPVIRDARKPWSKGPPLVLRVSTGGDIVAVANTYGTQGAVLELPSGNVSMNLRRDKYHPDVSVFPLAIAELDDQILVIHGTEWNRLDVSDARTGVLLTQRQPTQYKKGEPRPPHYLDYFHGDLSISPGQQYVADNGWVWQPAGVITTWNLRRWLDGNVWESEDGPTKKSPCWRYYYWDGPLCWLEDHRLCVWGYGKDDEWLIPAVMLFDLRANKMERWFAGPKGSLVFDEYLFSFDSTEGMTVWDVASGKRMAHEPGFCPAGYHRNGKHFLSAKQGTVTVSRLV